MKLSGSVISVILGTCGAVAAAWLYVASAPQGAPQVTFATLKGELINTSDLRGKVTLINFWATSCAPCVKELPGIAATYKKYNAQGFETIAVAMEYDPPNYVKSFSERNQLPFKVALDARGEIAKEFGKINGDVRVVPTSFVIDKQGRVIKSYLGELDFVKFEALLQAALKEAA
jgi:peroxiredoxin